MNCHRQSRDSRVEWSRSNLFRGCCETLWAHSSRLMYATINLWSLVRAWKRWFINDRIMCRVYLWVYIRWCGAEIFWIMNWQCTRWMKKIQAECAFNGEIYFTARILCVPHGHGPWGRLIPSGPRRDWFFVERKDRSSSAGAHWLLLNENEKRCN